MRKGLGGAQLAINGPVICPSTNAIVTRPASVELSSGLIPGYNLTTACGQIRLSGRESAEVSTRPIGNIPKSVKGHCGDRRPDRCSCKFVVPEESNRQIRLFQGDKALVKSKDGQGHETRDDRADDMTALPGIKVLTWAISIHSGSGCGRIDLLLPN